PVLLTHAGDGSDRVFVVEQTGRIVVGTPGGPLSVFLDVSGLLVSGGEQGLLGLAFHPDYADNGRFFINYTDTNGDTVIAEYRAASPRRADPNSTRVLLHIDQPYPNHNGGHLAFGPDGYLYVGMGDGGSAGDPEERAQDLDSLLGKLLRIDVDARGRGRPYGIPEDNPFADRGGRPEIWAYGLRNPWRFTFDRGRAELWIADVGQNVLEEINRVPSDESGVNYGWDVMEGSRCFEPPSGCDRSRLMLPVAEYDHDLGCSVTGGYVYRGPDFVDMAGGYFFGDYCTGRVWVLDAARPRAVIELADTDLSISSFGEDEQGELYVTDLSGRVLRVIDRSR
ncbi:MAG: PQQ-dependent sugar dehydrogenase, partial [Actinomycetota bacterium]|nr:PQQ-dependent sugar dehydrogenase [Actinomycetota bacterium]